MKRFPALTAKQVIRILKGFGFQEDRQRGSHLILINSLTKRRTIVPIHPGKTIKKPLLKSIVEKDVGVSIEEFLKYL